MKQRQQLILSKKISSSISNLFLFLDRNRTERTEKPYCLYQLLSPCFNTLATSGTSSTDGLSQMGNVLSHCLCLYQGYCCMLENLVQCSMQDPSCLPCLPWFCSGSFWLLEPSHPIQVTQLKTS